MFVDVAVQERAVILLARMIVMRTGRAILRHEGALLFVLATTISWVLTFQ